MSTARFLLVFLVVLAPASAGLAQRSASGQVGPISDSTISASKLQIAPNALGWQLGDWASNSGQDCLNTGSSGPIVSGRLGYYGDPNSSPPSPKAGDPFFYTVVQFQNSSACQFPGAQPFLILPANTTLAISGTNPVHCFRDGQPVTPCSQSLQLGTSLAGYTGYNLGQWFQLRTLGPVEIQIPLSSSSSGIKTLTAAFDTTGGDNAPFTASTLILVGAVAPYVSYPTTPLPTTLITNTTARTTADVYNQFQPGTFFFDLGTTTAYGTSTGGNAVPNTDNGFRYFVDWSGLNPGTLYHWRGRFVYSGGTVVGADQTFTTTGTVTLPTAPTSVAAVPVSPTQVTVTWDTVVGTTSYQIWRRGPDFASTYTQVGTTSITSYTDSSAVANSSYQYVVRAVNGAGSSPNSFSDLATTVMYTDDRLVGGVTPIKAVHLNELRTAVNAMRTLAGQGAVVFTAFPGLTVKAAHILDLRTQFDSAMGVITGTNSTWATTPVAGGRITFSEFQQLRDRLK